jgi:hypothetical protein
MARSCRARDIEGPDPQVLTGVASGAIAELGQVTPDPLAYVDDETVELHRPIRPLGYGAPTRPWDAPAAWVRWAPQGQADHRCG